MIRIAIITGSTRPGRKVEAVSKWVYETALQRSDADFQIIDIKDFDLPLLDEPIPAAMNQYTKPHTLKWAETIAAFDGYVFVTPEYNHSTSAALKNAIDYLYKEWENKAAGFVSYGAIGGARAVENLRLVMGNLMVATVRDQVMLSLFADFENYEIFKPHPRHEKNLHSMFEQVIVWAKALSTVREKNLEEAA